MRPNRSQLLTAVALMLFAALLILLQQRPGETLSSTTSVTGTSSSLSMAAVTLNLTAQEPGPTETSVEAYLATRLAGVEQTMTIRAKTPTLTVTPSPTRTQTATITPGRSRFDFPKGNTFTPAAAAQCPLISLTLPAPIPDIKNPITEVADEQRVVDYLNTYGVVALASVYEKLDYPGLGKPSFTSRDVNNDGVPEVIFGMGNLAIFGCVSGKYQTLYYTSSDMYFTTPQIIQLVDTNLNGLLEISLLTGFWSQGAHEYRVIEWNGKEFVNVLEASYPTDSDEIFVESSGSFDIDDIDMDGVPEYVANIGLPSHFDGIQLGFPWREEKKYFRWDGQKFSLYKRLFSTPKYRFQAIEDGDYATFYGDYDRALDSYQQAIFNDKLEWWSDGRYESEWKSLFAVADKSPTPTLPAHDPQEYDYIASYARYRILLLHAARGWASDAQVVYQTLQEKYPSGKVGSIYAQLATSFWDAYHQTNSVQAGCEAALEFAQQHHNEVFPYIGGNSYKGLSAIKYEDEPYMICPFQ